MKRLTLLILMFAIVFIGTQVNAGECTRDDAFDIPPKHKNLQGGTSIIIRVIDETTGEPVPYPVIQLGRPYYTYMGKSCWICDDSKWSWTVNDEPRFESRPSDGVFVYDLGKDPLSGRFDPKRVTSQSDPVKVCIRIYKPNCNYCYEGLATIHLGCDNYFKVFLDCPKRLRVE